MKQWELELRFLDFHQQSDYVDPIRILYDVTCNDIKPSDDGRGQALLKNGTINITAKELVKQTIYGPDNVPTTAF